jgi:hypothetical protein
MKGRQGRLYVNRIGPWSYPPDIFAAVAKREMGNDGPGTGKALPPWSQGPAERDQASAEMALLSLDNMIMERRCQYSKGKWLSIRVQSPKSPDSQLLLTALMEQKARGFQRIITQLE